MSYNIQKNLVYGVELTPGQAKELENLLRNKLKKQKETNYLVSLSEREKRIAHCSFSEVIVRLKFVKEDYSHDVVLRGQDADSRANHTNGYNNDCSEFIFGVENDLAISTNKRKGPSDMMKKIWETKLKNYVEKIGVTTSPKFHTVDQTH